MATGTNQSLALTGLASGLDTSSIVSALMQVNSLPEVALKNRQTQDQARQSALTAIESELQNLKDAADALSDPTLFADTQTVDTSDPTKVTATRVSGAGTGGTQITVARLASSQQRTYNYTSSGSDTLLDFGGGKTLTVAAGTSVDDLVSAINSGSSLPVYAASITDPNDPTGQNKLLVLSSKTPGSSGDFSLAADSTAGLSEITADAKANAATGASQTFSYTADAVNPQTVTVNGVGVSINAGATLDDVISAINGTSGVGATASKDANNQLVITSGTLGSSSSLSVSSSQLAQVSSTAGTDSTLTNLNAMYYVDGSSTPRYADSNTVTDAIPGISLTFKAASTDPVTVIVGSPAPDKTAIHGKVTDFISQYNAVMDDLNSKLNDQPVVNASSPSDLVKGLFFGDPMLENIQDNLRNLMMSPIGSDSSLNLLSEIGISTGDTTGDGTINQDSVSGKLTLDADKLDSMLDSNPDGVQKLLGATLGGNGFGQAFDALVAPELDPSNGDFASQQTQVGDELSDLANQISDMDDNLQQTQQRLQAQFAAMETALSSSQSQQQWLMGEISGLSANG
ncbi:MAG TPA: flagellar filament capping protein FliD [Thermoleophilaceae bacterium]|nr:flagellar filament capping protein FliD [Thermoleophilaceae bacterium]